MKNAKPERRRASCVFPTRRTTASTSCSRRSGSPPAASQTAARSSAPSSALTAGCNTPAGSGHGGSSSRGERVTDVLLRDSVDARGELQLGGRLHLRMDAARLARDVDERRGALRQRTAREPARAHLLPGQKNRRRSTSLPPVSHQNRPRSMIWTCAAEGSSSACSSRYFTSQLRTAAEASSVVTRSPSTRSAYFGINRRSPRTPATPPLRAPLAPPPAAPGALGTASS